MTGSARASLLIVVATLSVAACARARVTPPQRPGQDLVALLADADGSVGEATASNPAGSVTLDRPRAYTLLSPGAAPQPPAELSEADVERIFGAALAAQPPAPVRFALFFQFDSEQLTPESQAVLPDVLAAVKTYPAARVSVVGNTDTTGPAAGNIQLGLRRARTVRALLVGNGLDESTIDVTSHGESTLLVPTADEVFEPKNRRVDITVR